MTTTIYRVAYPHPFLKPGDRVTACSVDPKTYRKNLLAQLCEEYPKYTQDLKQATIWKVPPLLSITRCLPQPGLQASDLSVAEVCSDSMRRVYDWINRKDGSAQLSRHTPLAESFPDGPHEEPLEKVDIVVVTQESTSWRASLSCSL